MHALNGSSAMGCTCSFCKWFGLPHLLGRGSSCFLVSNRQWHCCIRSRRPPCSTCFRSRWWSRSCFIITGRASKRLRSDEESLLVQACCTCRPTTKTPSGACGLKQPSATAHWTSSPRWDRCWVQFCQTCLALSTFWQTGCAFNHCLVACGDLGAWMAQHDRRGQAAAHEMRQRDEANAAGILGRVHPFCWSLSWASSLV